MSPCDGMATVGIGCIDMKTRFFRAIAFLLVFSAAFASLRAQPQTSVEALIEQLSTEGRNDPDRQGRRDAARLLGEMGPDAADAVPALIIALEDRDTQVWFHSVTALARIGEAAQPAIPALLEDLASRGRRGVNAKWYRSAYALGNMGASALPQLRSALTDSDASVRSGVIKALGWLGQEASPVVSDLIASLADEDEDVRAYAAETLGKIGDTALPGVEATLDSPNHTARLAALEAVKALGPIARPLTEKILTLAESGPAPDLQARALATLSSVGLDPERLASLCWTLADHTDQQVRHEVANYLLDLPASLTIPALTERLNSDSPETRMWAADLLGRRGPSASPAVASLIERVNQAEEVSERTIYQQAIATLGPAATTGLFDYLASHRDLEITPEHWIIQCLGSYGLTGLSRVSQGLTHETVPVRLAAIYAIRQLGADGRSATLKIEQSLSDPDARIRAASLLSLVAISQDPDRYRLNINQLLADAHPDARWAAARSIPRISTPESSTIERLGTLLADSDDRVRLASAQALSSIGKKAESQTQSLAALIIDPNEIIKQAAIQALGEIGQAPPLAIAQIAHLANHATEALKLTALRSLGQLPIGDPRIAKVYRTAVTHQDKAIREAALAAYGRVIDDETEVINVTIQALKDDAIEVRLTAAKNLGTFGEEAIPATQPLMALLDDRENFTVYLDALKRIPAHESQLESYQAGLEHRNPGVRSHACEQLGNLAEKGMPAVQALERLARRDRYSFVKQRARTALERITGEEQEEEDDDD